MSRLHRIAVIAAACVIVNTSLASGQDRPVAFLHGAFSSSNTWQAAASALQQQLALEAFRPDTNPQSQISVQAGQVDNAIGFLPFSTVAVTHSNGGLVGRQWSRTHPLSGLVTMGTPNYGLPVVENLLRWADFNEEAYFRLSGLFDAFLNCASVQSCTWSIVSEVFYYQSLNELMSTIAGVLTSNWLEVASTVGFVVIDQVAYEMDVIPQTATNSSFLANLNGTVGSELTAARVGIVTTAYNYDQAGYYRLKDPESADTVAFLVDLGAFLMDTGATYIYGTVDPNDYFALNVANWLTFGANILYNADWYWCRVLTSPTFADECWENDTLVPVNSQVLPNAAYLPQFGPAHIRETTQSNAKLYEALTVFMAIPPRSGGGGGPMQPNSAIVGCSNWSWLAPVYKPDAASCYSYCQQYLADACEWTSEQQGASNPGDCYVEYGDGCSVAGGYSTWSAAVLNLGGPPSGGGGGDGQMHADSAVRGCIGWSWWDPVYQPDANSCAAFCVQNGADACEWYVNGDCYVEFGDSCYVEPGYSGWSAMVAP